MRRWRGLRKECDSLEDKVKEAEQPCLGEQVGNK